MMMGAEMEQRKGSILADNLRSAIDALERGAEDAGFAGAVTWEHIMGIHLLRRGLILYVTHSIDPVATIQNEAGATVYKSGRLALEALRAARGEPYQATEDRGPPSGTRRTVVSSSD